MAKQRVEYQIVFPALEVERTVHKWVTETSPGGFTSGHSVEIGHEDVTFSVKIDMRRLLGMGRRAAANVTGVCKAGPLKCEVIRRQAK